MRTAKKEKSLFSRQLIRLRQSRRLTQEQLASALGIARSAVAYYETQAKNPEADLVRKLADFFNVDPGELISDGSQKKTTGPKSKIECQLEAIRELPPKKQKTVSEMLDMVLAH